MKAKLGCKMSSVIERQKQKTNKKAKRGFKKLNFVE